MSFEDEDEDNDNKPVPPAQQEIDNTFPIANIVSILPLN